MWRNFFILLRVYLVLTWLGIITVACLVYLSDFEKQVQTAGGGIELSDNSTPSNYKSKYTCTLLGVINCSDLSLTASSRDSLSSLLRSQVSVLGIPISTPLSQPLNLNPIPNQTQNISQTIFSTPTPTLNPISNPGLTLTPTPTSRPNPPPATPTVIAYNSANQEIARYTCDGTDDQVEIQKAIDSLNNLPGKIELSAGTFTISSSVIIKANNITLEGQGDNTVVFLKNESNCNMITNSASWAAKDNVTIRNFKIDGNKDKQFQQTQPADVWTGGKCIVLRGKNAVYENLTIENCYRYGISQDYGDNAKIDHNTIRNCRGKAINLDHALNGEIFNNNIYNCGLIDEEGMKSVIGIWLGGNNKIYNNYIDGGGRSEQLIIWDSPNAEIKDNTLKNGLFMGIRPRGIGSRVINNKVINSGENAIDPSGSKNIRIEGNYVDGVYKRAGWTGHWEGSGICLNASDSTVKGNTVINAFNGIHLGGTNDNNQIIDNVIKNNGAGVPLGTWGGDGIWIQIWESQPTYTGEDLISRGNVIRGNQIIDDQATHTQVCGIRLNPDNGGKIADTIIQNNNFSGNRQNAVCFPKDLSTLPNTTINNNSGTADFINP
jgi:parallel beta-helix repeat protein